MEVNHDSFTIPNENLTLFKGGSGAVKMRHLDSLLTSVYQSVTCTWLENRLDVENAQKESHPHKDDHKKAFQLIYSLLHEDKPKSEVGTDHSQNIVQRPTIWLKGQYPAGKADSVDSELPTLLYLRIWDTNWEDTIAVLQHCQQKLKTGGLLVLEIIRFSGFTAYPYHYSFSRTVELIASLETRKVMPEQWPALLAQNGFGILDRANSSASFLPRQHNRIISHSLEAVRSDILERTNTAEAEIDALIPSLKQYEEQQDTLICRPGVHLVLARKT